MRLRFFFLFLLSTIGLVGTPRLSFGDTAHDETLLQAASERWDTAFTAHDTESMVALTTDEFVLIPPNAPPIRGTDAAQEFWRQTSPPDVEQTSLSVEETALQGDIAYRTGTYSQTLPNGTVVKRGMFMDIWKRVDGYWRLHRHMYSISEPTTSSDKLVTPAKNKPMLEHSVQR